MVVVAYLLLKLMNQRFPAGYSLVGIGTIFMVVGLITRLIERLMVKRYRHAGFNTRYVTFVGNDPELLNIYHRLNDDPSMGYHILGYYADGEMPVSEEEGRTKGGERKALTLNKLGSLKEFLDNMGQPEKLKTGDELYVCLSRQDRDIIRRISQFCDHNVIRFYFVPMSVETLGIDMKREFLDNIEIFTTYDNKLERPSNKLIKRIFDIVFSIIFLIPTALIFPFVWLIIKIQSPGPLLFKQARTGIDGQTFNMLKFRSMHVNDDADKLQATKDDPRKYPFGDFMRKTNIDELPQFINVLRGDMSIVGPRPHMLAHTEQYSELIDKYMVRHFVKPGLTGWAQVTGFRGETKELWQMEGRVKRDIWYMEHWSIWLDIRIIWLTFKSMFIHDKNAY
jgi:putative colanic acid biosynthesis UDP-glucose lipid carrier transferase